MKFWSRGDDWVANQVYWRSWSGFEPEMSPIFYQFACDADVVLDIGAHVGFYTILAACANPAGHVFAFEPMPNVYQRLQRNISLNQLPNVTAVQSAASSETGKSRLFHASEDGIPSSSSLSLTFMQSLRDRVVSTSVSVFTIDDYLSDYSVERIDLVKLDTETTEVDVLDGMRGTLLRDRPAIFCEVLASADVARLADLLKQYRYQYYQLTSSGLVERTQLIADPNWPNYLFVSRPEHAAWATRSTTAWSTSELPGGTVMDAA